MCEFEHSSVFQCLQALIKCRSMPAEFGGRCAELWRCRWTHSGDDVDDVTMTMFVIAWGRYKQLKTSACHKEEALLNSLALDAASRARLTCCAATGSWKSTRFGTCCAATSFRMSTRVGIWLPRVWPNTSWSAQRTRQGRFAVENVGVEAGRVEYCRGGGSDNVRRMIPLAMRSSRRRGDDECKLAMSSSRKSGEGGRNSTLSLCSAWAAVLSLLSLLSLWRLATPSLRTAWAAVLSFLSLLSSWKFAKTEGPSISPNMLRRSFMAVWFCSCARGHTWCGSFPCQKNTWHGGFTSVIKKAVRTDFDLRIFPKNKSDGLFCTISDETDLQNVRALSCNKNSILYWIFVTFDIFQKYKRAYY